VAGSVVAVELVGLAVLLERSLVLVHLFGARRAIFVAEDANGRAREILRHVDRRDRRFVVELFLAHHHAAAPKVGTGVYVFPLGRINHGVATT
jgi:hypothetical protein